MRDPEYRRAMSDLTTPLEAVGEPLDRFVVLKNPEPQPAAADTAMTFTVEDHAAAGGAHPSGDVATARLGRDTLSTVATPQMR